MSNFQQSSAQKRVKQVSGIPATVMIVRIVVGLLFIFSGLVKANDPLGLSYKMQEFFDAWGWNALNWSTFSLSIAMNAFEILLGVAMLVGYRMRLFSWLILLLTLFFGFLTGYAALSGKFQSCGCFGDCLPLTPIQSFLKDIALLILVLYIFIYRHKIRSRFSIKAAVSFLIIALAFALALQAYVLKHLPFVDCLPYKKGNHLLEQMQVPPGAIADSFAITFRYQHAGKVVEFDANHFPEDFDSTYQYVDRYDKLIRKGNAIPKVTDFSLKTPAGADSTQELLTSQQKYVLVLFKNFEAFNDQKAGLTTVIQQAHALSVPVMIATPEASAASSLQTGADQIFELDAVVEKTAARANPTYFLMQGDYILEKKSQAELKTFLSTLKGNGK
ncbi:DoxX protein [Arachidicoccus rhizosphaerae]|uniref:DoxX protein n=1 Tax=Arachidicoccus rhizosphaerae TaxID=551991 RepID=A0A1H3VNR9_9BACT|nr:BT_3928 family protein [Arachidicoccus rhizosphaerae]SDZ75768.1 DoxX protein [Arachidicoccus rhizosphaerae]